MSTGEYANNCITGPNQVSIIVQITDVCPQCEANHIDLQALTYNKVQLADAALTESTPFCTILQGLRYLPGLCIP